jgi:hypothetical protein
MLYDVIDMNIKLAVLYIPVFMMTIGGDELIIIIITMLDLLLTRSLHCSGYRRRAPRYLDAFIPSSNKLRTIPNMMFPSVSFEHSHF